MKDEHTAAATNEQALRTRGPIEAAGGAGGPADVRDVRELGLEEVEVDPLEPLSPKTKLTAWGLGIGGAVAFASLALGAIVVIDWLIPYVRYLYLLWLGSGSADF